MKKTILLICLLISSLPLFSGQIEFIYSLESKEEIVYEDLVTMFCYLTGHDASDDYEAKLAYLSERIDKLPQQKGRTDRVTLGDFSLLAVQYLNLNGGILYTISRSGRYALRELIYRGILSGNLSEYELLTGTSLLNLVQKVEYYAQ